MGKEGEEPYSTCHFLVEEGMEEKAESFLEVTLNEKGVPLPLANRFSIILDELSSNIVKYSGAKTLALSIAVEDNRIALRFVYDGDDFDVTKAPEPDIAGSAESRRIGGLGLLMVKKMSDVFTYERVDEHNIVFVGKSWEPMPPKEKP